MGHFMTKWTKTKNLNINYFINAYFVTANVRVHRSKNQTVIEIVAKKDMECVVDIYDFVK